MKDTIRNKSRKESCRKDLEEDRDKSVNTKQGTYLLEKELRGIMPKCRTKNENI
jgi:hypothetical protein